LKEEESPCGDDSMALIVQSTIYDNVTTRGVPDVVLSTGSNPDSLAQHAADPVPYPDAGSRIQDPDMREDEKTTTRIQLD